MAAEIMTKEKPANMQGIHRNKHAALTLIDGKFTCIIGYQPSSDGGSYSYTDECVCDHPLEALRIYEHTFFPGINVWFDNWLEDHGYPRYGCTRRREI